VQPEVLPVGEFQPGSMIGWELHDRKRSLCESRHCAAVNSNVRGSHSFYIVVPAATVSSGGGIDQQEDRPK
jgi:hypothetical protein